MVLTESHEMIIRTKGFATSEMDDGTYSWESIDGSNHGFADEDSAIRDFLEFADQI